MAKIQEEDDTYLIEAVRAAFGDKAIYKNLTMLGSIEVPSLGFSVCIQHPIIKLENICCSDSDKAWGAPYGRNLLIGFYSDRPLMGTFPHEFEVFYEKICKGSGFMFISKPNIQKMLPSIIEFLDGEKITFERGDISQLIISYARLIEANKEKIADMLIKPYPAFKEGIICAAYKLRS